MWPKQSQTDDAVRSTSDLSEAFLLIAAVNWRRDLIYFPRPNQSERFDAP